MKDIGDYAAFKTGNLAGITVLDYFAAMAMQGLVGDPNCVDKVKIAKWAYEMAEEMVEQKRKRL